MSVLKRVWLGLVLSVLMQTGWAVPPGNDNCSGNFQILALPYVYDGQTWDAASDFSLACPPANIAASDVVFTLNLPTTTLVTASVCDGTNFDAEILIRTGGACPGNTDVVCSSDACGAGLNRGIAIFTATAGVNYYLVIGGDDALEPFGDYRLRVTGADPGPPVHDACPGLTIPALPFTYTGNTIQAGTDFDLQCSGGQLIVNEVVFTLTVPVMTQVWAELCAGTLFNAQLFVLSDGACPGDNNVACSYNDCGAGFERGAVGFVAAAGTPYYLIIGGGSAPAWGAYELVVSGYEIPANDACPGTQISALPFSDTGSTTFASNDYAFSCDAGDPNTSDVFYHLTLAECHEVTASLCGSNFNTQLVVRSQAPCPGNYLVECNDDYCGEQSQVTFVAHAGWNYFLIIDGVGEMGDYVLNVTGTPLATPVNDNCPGTLISTLPFSDTGNTGCATNNFGYVCGTPGQHREVVYTLNLAEPGTVTASLCGSAYNTMLLVRSGGDCPGTTEVVCNNDYCGEQSLVSFLASAGTNYYLLVEGVPETDGIGTYVLDVTLLPPENDTCPGVDITSFPFVYDGNNTNAATDYGLSCGTAGAHDVVFRYFDTGQCYSEVTASLCEGTNFDAQVYVRMGGNCPGDVEVDCDGTSCMVAARGSVTFSAAPNVPYYILVAGPGVGAVPYGDYRLTVTRSTNLPPPHDTCPAKLIPGLPYTDYGSTVCATDDYMANTFDDGREVVYEFTLTQCYDVTATLCGSSYNTFLSARSGSECPGTRFVGNDDFCGQQSQVRFFRNAGTYWITVGGSGDGAYGDYVLNVQGTPLNGGPDCPYVWINELPFAQDGSTLCSAPGLNGHVCGTDSSNRNVIYGLLLPQCAQITATLCGLDYDSQIMVRAGGACPGDTVVACNTYTAISGCGSRGSRVQFTALPEEAYYILAGGLNYLSGDYHLTLEGSTCQPPVVNGLIVMPRTTGTSLELRWRPVAGASSYAVYRGLSFDFALDLTHRVATVADTSWVDPGAINPFYGIAYYVVTASNLLP